MTEDEIRRLVTNTKSDPSVSLGEWDQKCSALLQTLETSLAQLSSTAEEIDTFVEHLTDDLFPSPPSTPSGVRRSARSMSQVRF